MKAYFISGLGCDRRAFQRIFLPEGYEIVHLDWVRPEKDEALVHYSLRLAEGIDESEPFILVGLSFGGIVAVEISKKKKPLKLFLISSVASRKELPLIYRWAGRFYLDRLIPGKWLKQPNFFLYHLFGPLGKETRPLFQQILQETDPVFLTWALGEIARWKNRDVPGSLIRIHSTKDRIFPFQHTENSRLVRSGGHFCVYTNGSEINRILKKELTFNLPAVP